MSPPRDPFVQPVAHIAEHWKIVAGACAVALLVSLTATLLLPQKYSAVTRIFIEPPAGSDPRTSTTVSPIYLDSLLTYELFASSDTLLLQAVERFHLRQNGAPVDRLKRSILKVEVPRNTKILDISATLSDPTAAHELSLFLAQETVKMNQNTSEQGDRDFAAAAERQYAAERSSMDAAQKAWDATPDQVAAESLRSEVVALDELRDGLRRELTELEVSDPEATGEGANRIAAYRRRLAALTDQIAGKRKELAAVTAHLEVLESDFGSARRTFGSSEARVGLAVAGGVITGALAVAWLFPTLSEAYWQRASSVTSVFSSPENALSGRVGNWESLAGFLRQYPGYALLGIGYKTIPYSDLFGGRVVSDNVYLMMLVAAGILGLVAVLCLNATILRSAYRAAHSFNGTTAFFGSWIFCFGAGESVQMLSGDLLTYWRVLPLYCWALAIATRGYHEDPDRGPV